MDKCDSNQRCIPYTILISGESEIPSIRLSGKLDIKKKTGRSLLERFWAFTEKLLADPDDDVTDKK